MELFMKNRINIALPIFILTFLINLPVLAEPNSPTEETSKDRRQKKRLEAHKTKAESYFGNGSYKKAVKQYKKIVKRSKNPEEKAHAIVQQCTFKVTPNEFSACSHGAMYFGETGAVFNFHIGCVGQEVTRNKIQSQCYKKNNAYPNDRQEPIDLRHLLFVVHT